MRLDRDLRVRRALQERVIDEPTQKRHGLDQRGLARAIGTDHGQGRGKTLAARRRRIPTVRTGLLGQGKGHLGSFLEREEILERKGVKHDWAGRNGHHRAVKLILRQNIVYIQVYGRKEAGTG